MGINGAARFPGTPQALASTHGTKNAWKEANVG
jgi:hypothetical protein